MPKDLVVTARWAREANLIGNLAHGASWEGEGNSHLYIWCFGETAASLWASAPEGTPVLCLRCIVYGPRGEWETESPLGDRVREESREGCRVIAVDTETRGSR